MLASFRVQATIGQSQTLDRLSADNVRLDDFVDVGFGDVAVPDGIRVNHDVGAVLALIETSGLIGADATFQSASSELLFEELLQARFGSGVAASARMACGALVSTNKNVAFEFGHCVF